MSNIRENSLRIRWIDVARGLLIIAIVLGHVYDAEGFIKKWVYSFHVQAFFFLSGFCFKKSNEFLGFLKKKAGAIVVPYLFFSILSFLIFYVGSFMLPSIKNLMNCDIAPNLFMMLYGNSKLENAMAYNRPLWFLTCYFSVSLLAFLVERLKSKFGQSVCVYTLVVCACIGVFENMYESIALPWHLETAFSMLVWFETGVILRDNLNCFSGDNLIKKFKNLAKTKQYIISFICIFIGGGYLYF